MKYPVLYIFLLLSLNGIAQNKKPPIDTSIGKVWEYITQYYISDNGRYVAYSVFNPQTLRRNTIIQRTDRTWQRSLQNVRDLLFVPEKEELLVTHTDGHLEITAPESEKTESLGTIDSYKLIRTAQDNFLIYQLKEEPHVLRIRNLRNGTTTEVPGMIKWFQVENANTLIVITADGTGYREISQFTLAQQISKAPVTRMADTASDIIKLTPDNNLVQFAFLTKKPSPEGGVFSIWYFKKGMDSPVELRAASEEMERAHFSLCDGNLFRFNKNGDKLFYQLQQYEEENPLSLLPGVDVWSYTDIKLQSQQLKELKSNAGKDARKIVAAYDIANGRVNTLSKTGETVDIIKETADRFAVITRNDGYEAEQNWNKAAARKYKLLNLETGKSSLIQLRPMETSPGGRFLLLNGLDRRDYYTYEFATGKLRNITEKLPIEQSNPDKDEIPDQKVKSITGVACWTKGDTSLVIYDRFDIWKIDPAAGATPVNLTKGEGIKRNISFTIPDIFITDRILKDSIVILSAFNKFTKQNGFYSADFATGQAPKALHMESAIFQISFNQAGLQTGKPPVKARTANTYFVIKSTASSSPNLYQTHNFIDFEPVSSIHPEQNFNWLTAQLLNWTGRDGKPRQGILYLPEDFDSLKKYPVIVHYYEKMSNRLNEFKAAELLIGPINIPMMVSNGYIVVCADILYKTGEPGESVLNSVLPLVTYLKKKRWVNAEKMGIQGQSFGGFETNYLVTHTHVFAAAMSTSGLSNFVSGYNSIGPGAGWGLGFQYETDQLRIGASLWERPDLFLKNSPVLDADKITTPLLLMSNKDDAIVPFSQGMEMFLALRRLGKKGWLLQYDNEAHVLLNLRNKIDLTIRTMQFFDHFLKDKPAPVWMTQGIPAALKGKKKGFEPDEGKDTVTKTGNW